MVVAPPELKVIVPSVTPRLNVDTPAVVTVLLNLTVLPIASAWVIPRSAEPTLTVPSKVLAPLPPNIIFWSPVTAPPIAYAPSPCSVTAPVESVTPFIVVTPPAVKTIPSRTVAPSRLETPPVVTSPRKVALPADTD